MTLAVVLAAAPAAAQLYRWTHADGTVHYTADLNAIPPAYRDAASLLAHPQARPAPPPGPPEAATIRVDPRAPLTVGVRLNGVPLTLVVDTGAERTVISPAALERAGFGGLPGRPIQILGVTGTATAQLVTVPLLDVAGARIGPLAVIAHALPVAGRSEPVDGLLGRDVLDAFTLTVDTASGRATLTLR
ncbi:MAG: clan AA aspartic protease [Candidatus Rokubacteria bacterium]|nr:clan AA aspartic protease [Candidatus Rokubacteria bacterium]